MERVVRGKTLVVGKHPGRPSAEAQVLSEKTQGDRATLELELLEGGTRSAPPIVFNLRKEGGFWRLAGMEFQGMGGVDEAAQLLAHLDDPHLGEKLEALARAENESRAIGDVRTVISAEIGYQSANMGYYDTPACLGAPAKCMAGYTGPSFLDPELASLSPKNGYRRVFHPGPAPRREELRKAKASPSSLTSYAYVAVPVDPGRTGRRGFCGDASGRICVTSDGAAAPVRNGQCAADCTPLQ
jgi:hypothetical protein